VCKVRKVLKQSSPKGKKEKVFRRKKNYVGDGGQEVNENSLGTQPGKRKKGEGGEASHDTPRRAKCQGVVKGADDNREYT